MPLTAFVVSGKMRDERMVNSALTSDGHPKNGVYYSNANATNCETSAEVHNDLIKHFNSITCALGHVANPYKSLRE